MKNQNEPEKKGKSDFSKFSSIFGLILVCCGSYLLLWNEGRTIKTSMALEEGLRYITVPETIYTIDPKNEDKLVLVGGHLGIRNSIRDDVYGVSIHAVKLQRVVEVYQWKETEHKEKLRGKDADGQDVIREEKSYTYKKDWYDHHIDSAAFNENYWHQNPPKSFWPAESMVKTNDDVKIGSFLLGSTLKNKISNFQPLRSDQLPYSALGIHNGMYYHSKNLWKPEIGDYRIKFLSAGKEGEAFTIVGKQSGEEIVPYQTVTGEELLILQTGLKDAGEVFTTEDQNNKIWSWVFRPLGWLLTFLGLFCLSTLLEQVLGCYSFFRSLMAWGVASLPFVVSISHTLIIIGIGRISYHPLTGLSLLILGLLPFTGLVSNKVMPVSDSHVGRKIK